MSMQFRLLAGAHNQDGVNYEAGQIINSEIDLCKAFNVSGYRPKFENIAGTTESRNFVYDPAMETLEQFTAKVRTAQANKEVKKEGPAAVWDPKVESLDQFYRRMSDKGPPTSPPSTFTPEKKEQSQPLQGGAVSTTVLKTDAQLNAMSLQDLQKYAADEEIDIGHAKDKASIVKVIKAYQGS